MTLRPETGRSNRTQARSYRAQILHAAIGASVRAHRERVDMTRAALARACGVDISTMTSLEDGVTVSLLLVVDIADALDLSLDDLVPIGWETPTL